MIRKDLRGILNAVSMIRRFHKSCDLRRDVKHLIAQRNGIADLQASGLRELPVKPHPVFPFRVKCFSLEHIHPADIIVLNQVQLKRNILHVVRGDLYGQHPVGCRNIFIGKNRLQLLLRKSFPRHPKIRKVVCFINLFRADPHAIHIGMYACKYHDREQNHHKNHKEL